MLIVTSNQMSEIEKKACEKGFSNDSFMVLAGSNIAKILIDKSKHKKIILLCGKGNNGGDAYVAGTILLKKGFIVIAYYFNEPKSCSDLNQKYFKEFKNCGGKARFIEKLDDLCLPDDAVIVDALLGTGFKGALKEPYLELTKKINASKLTIFSVDIPSGLNGTSGVVENVAIKAHTTIFLGFLKSGFFLNDGPNYTGNLIHADFGLPHELGRQVSPFANYFQKNNVQLPEINKKRHKYNTGYVLGVAGSQGMSGAGFLSSFAALKSGAGIVRLYSMGKSIDADPKPLEIIHQFLSEENLNPFFDELKRATAIFMGPGMGKDKSSENIFIKIIERINIPAVLDADALFFLSKNPDINLRQDTILTPHHGEMHRLLNEKNLDDVELIAKTIDYSKKKKVIVVLKGAPTFVIHYDEKPFVIASGTPALATAGTGDVLTGIIAAQVSQKILPLQAAAQGAFLHGLAAQIAEKKMSTYSLVASDVIDNLPKAFKIIENTFGIQETN